MQTKSKWKMQLYIIKIVELNKNKVMELKFNVFCYSFTNFLLIWISMSFSLSLS